MHLIIKLFLFFLLFLFSIGVSGQISIDTTSNMMYDSTTNSSTDWSAYIGAFENVTPTEFAFDTISEKEFLKYRMKYRSKIKTDSTKLAWTDTSFTIATENWKTVFNTKITDDFPYNYYFGFLEPLNLFLVSNIDGKNELGILLLIDKITGKNYFLSSGFDYPNEALCISKENNYLLTYANNWAETNQCSLAIYKIEKNNIHFKLKFFNGSTLDSFTINELAWIDDTHFALSVKVKTDLNDYEKESGTNYFLKTSIVR